MSEQSELTPCIYVYKSILSNMEINTKVKNEMYNILHQSELTLCIYRIRSIRRRSRIEAAPPDALKEIVAALV